MPRYNYTCNDCDNDFKVRLSYAEVDTAQPDCPECGGMDCTRGLSQCNHNTGKASYAPVGGPSSSSCGGCSGGNCGTCSH